MEDLEFRIEMRIYCKECGAHKDYNQELWNIFDETGYDLYHSIMLEALYDGWWVEEDEEFYCRACANKL